MSDRQPCPQTPYHLTLGDLIAILEREDPAKRLALGFGEPHSYRGSYYDLAFDPMENVTVGEMLDAVRSALGATYNGYKGGEYVMNEWTFCWLARWGESGESIGRCFLWLMVAAESHQDAQDARKGV